MFGILENYTPHSAQQQIHDCTAKEIWEEAGRRLGKSRGGIGQLGKFIAEWYEDILDDKRAEGLVPGFHSWIVVPNYPQGRQVWNELKALMPAKLIMHIDEDDRTITMAGPKSKHKDDMSNNCFIELKSAHDPDGLQTVGLDFLWVMEAQDVSDRAANEKLRPTLRSPGRYGYALFEGIPAMWPDHWFRRGCTAAKRRTSRNHAYFHFTSFDNPLLTDEEKAEIEYDRELMTDAAWKRMYLAEFNLNAGFFKGIDGCIEGDVLNEPIPGGSYVAGLDFGVSQDATVLTIMDLATRKVMNRYRWDSTDWPMMRTHIIALHTIWNFYRVACDTSNMGGIAMYQELLEANMPVEEFKFQGENRQNLLGTLQVAIERASIHFPMIESLIRELRMFQYIRIQGVGGTVRYRVQAPQGENDDEVMALALAVEVCDAPIPVAQGGRMRRNCYIPTQAEYENGGNFISLGAQMMKDAKEARREARWQRSGVKS